MTSMVEYLTAKRAVDDRALNRRVWDRFADELADRGRGGDGPVRIVEVGAGVGSMVARLAARDGLPPAVSYRGVDLDENVVAAGRDRLPGWLEAAGYTVSRESDAIVARRRGDDGGATQRLEISLEVGDAFSIVDDADAVIAAAFLDLVALEPALARLRELCRDGGVVYAPLTFDGATGFTPPHPLDGRVERLYHRHMDEIRDQPGSSRAGRELLGAVPDAGYDVLAAGGSDWVVGAGEGETADEATVTRYLLETIDDALADYPEDVLAPATRERWLETRRRQLERGELVVLAHHLDVLARRVGD